jgi:eukaryotic-like serine/threonine-protein kinase
VDPKDNDSQDEPFDFSGKTLDADGNLESPPAAPAAPAAPRPSRVSRPAPPHQELQLEERPKAPALELEARPARAETDYVPPPAKRPPSTHGPSLAPGLALLVLAALGAGGWYYFLAKPRGPPGRVPIAVVILITSEPTGAEVSVEGSRMGVTPWAADNTWAKGPVNVTLTAPGYRPWTGTFPGGRPARLEAHLQRR